MMWSQEWSCARWAELVHNQPNRSAAIELVCWLVRQPKRRFQDIVWQGDLLRF